MRFAELVEELKNINEFKIVFINSGAFYIAVEYRSMFQGWDIFSFHYLRYYHILIIKF